jgi:hypothetical protein
MIDNSEKLQRLRDGMAIKIPSEEMQRIRDELTHKLASELVSVQPMPGNLIPDLLKAFEGGPYVMVSGKSPVWTEDIQEMLLTVPPPTAEDMAKVDAILKNKDK